MIVFATNMIGGVFMASNLASFENADTIHMVKEQPKDFVSEKIRALKKYQYIRYYPPKGKRINIAEIQFLNNTDTLLGKPIGSEKTTEQNIFDNNIRTNHNAPAHSWVGIDFGKPQPLTQIRYLVRNNFNIIEPDDIYELFYFDKGWKSLGIQKARTNELKFAVPQYALLLLKNISKGREERIFKYENDVQIFW